MWIMSLHFFNKIYKKQKKVDFYLLIAYKKNVNELWIPCGPEIFFGDDTDFDKAFELILKTSKENNIKQEELPSYLLIISDMEFYYGVYSKGGTNFDGWKQVFEADGYKLPTIIFWNIAGSTKGVPATKFDNDVAMVNGFSTNILENLLSLEEYTPTNTMMDKLSIYLEMLRR